MDWRCGTCFASMKPSVQRLVLLKRKKNLMEVHCENYALEKEICFFCVILRLLKAAGLQLG
jgi:hypothetical protein